MIRSELLYDFSGLNKADQFAANFYPLVFQGARVGFNQRIRLPLLQQLRKTPKRRYWTAGDFASDASRRAFFAKTGGKAYTRTGRLAAGWSTTISGSDNALAFSVQNPVPYEKFVSGENQVFGHAKTGWPLHKTTFDAWKPRVANMITNVVDDVIKKGFENG